MSEIKAVFAALRQDGYPSGATPECDHDWRLNPVVCATTTDGDHELWTCANGCGAQIVGPKIDWNTYIRRGKGHPFDPRTWLHV